MERKLYTLSGEGDSIFYMAQNNHESDLAYFANLNNNEECDAGWKNKKDAIEINPDHLETYTVTRIKLSCWEKHLR